jgi:hypothetical protein
MHQRTESGIPLDWHLVPTVTAEERKEAERLRQIERVKEAIALLDRHPTPEELAAAQAVIDSDPDAPQSTLNLKTKTA